MRRLLPVLLSLLLPVVCWPRLADAASDFLPGQDWYTVEAGPIAYHFTAAGRPWLPRLLQIGARAYDALAEWTGYAPSTTIHVVLIVDNDFANGSATPLPRNTIRLYPAHPRHPSVLQEYGDWLTLVYVHEMLHIFHLDTHQWPTTLFRKIFGRQIIPSVDISRGSVPLYLGFPNAFLPDTLIEGFAVWVEGELGGGIGRANGPLSLSLRRNFARTRDLPSLGSASGLRRDFPGGNAPRVFGGAFHVYVAEQLEQSWRDLYLLNARGVFPFFWGIPAWIEFGTRADLLWADWRVREQLYTRKFDSELRALHAGKRIAGPYLAARGLAVDDSGNVWLSVADGRQNDRIVRLQPDGESQTMQRRFGGAGFAVEPDGTLWFDDFRRLRDTATVSAIYTRSPHDKRARRVVDAHAFEPDVRGGKLVWVTREGARYCLVLTDVARTGDVRRTCAPEHQALHHPRLSPDGTEVAFVQWRPDSRHDLWLWQPYAGSVTLLAGGVGDQTQPQWHPLGRDVYFISTQTGAPELFAVRLSDSTRVQHTRTPTGVWDFALAPGDGLYYLAPEAGGWRVFHATLDQPFVPSSDVQEVSDSRVRLESVPPDPVTGPQLPEKSYRAARTLLPTGWTPIVRLDLASGSGTLCHRGRNNCAGGFILGGQDVLQQWSWGLALLFNGDADPTLEYAVLHDRGRWRIGGQGEFEPRFQYHALERQDYTIFTVERRTVRRRYRQRQELSLARMFRSMRMSNVARLHLAEEHLINTTRPVLESGAMLVHDSRDRFTWSLVPGNGLYGKFLAAGDHQLDRDYADGRLELIAATGGFLFARNQWQLQAAGGLDLHPLGRSFRLGGPGSGVSGTRTFNGRGVPTTDAVLAPAEICSPGEICRVRRFALWEIEAIWPLWWPQRGYGSLPLHLDQMHLRTYLAGAHMDREVAGRRLTHAMYAGVEWGTSLVFGWNAPIGPIMLGARWPLLDQRTGVPEIYLRVGIGVDQFGRFFAADHDGHAQAGHRLR